MTVELYIPVIENAPWWLANTLWVVAWYLFAFLAMSLWNKCETPSKAGHFGTFDGSVGMGVMWVMSPGFLPFAAMIGVLYLVGRLIERSR